MSAAPTAPAAAIGRPTVGVVGGTGPQGRGLGYRFAAGGHRVVLGSRSEDRAAEAAVELERRLSGMGGAVSGADNVAAVTSADVVLMAVPYDGHDELVESLAPSLAGKIVVSCVNPLGFDKRGPYGLDLGPTSAAEQAQERLPDSHVVGAFHHLSAVSLLGEAAYLDHEDVMVCGDDVTAKQTVMHLARTVTGRDGLDVGPLRLARQLEPLTAVLISINKRYRVRSGIHVAGLSDAS